MAYYTDLFTVETYEAFLKSNRTVSGFRESQRVMTQKVAKGDRFAVYVTGLSRWAAMLEVVGDTFTDDSPLFTPTDDPFIVRFPVKPLVCLELPLSIPIREEAVFETLSFTRGKRSGYWLGPLRRSLHLIPEADGRFLESLLVEQATAQKPYPIEAGTLDEFRPTQVQREAGVVSVTVPTDELRPERNEPKATRESIRAQADLARIGEAMGFRIWLPRNDRAAVLANWQPQHPHTLLNTLPLNSDDATIRTVEQIDVIWIKGRSIRRAFEVEHTTAVYSGLLRMADLLALQPNMDIALHIVAPTERREKVLSEIRRPVFSLLENQPLAKRCSFIGYESLQEIGDLPHLKHTTDSILEVYEDWAET